MVMSNITLPGIQADMTVIGAYQRFTNTNVSAAFQLDSSFVPTSMLTPLTNLELRNNTLSGYRFRQTTTDTDTIGSLILQSFTAASTTGTTIFTISNAGAFTINVPVTLAAKPYASLFMAGNSTPTTVVAAGTYVKVLGTTTLATSNLFTMPSNNRLTIGSTADCVINVSGSFVDSGGGSPYATYVLYKNGSIFADMAPMSDNCGSSRGHFSLTTNMSLAATDYVELFVTSSGSGIDVTVVDLNFVITGL